jgi:hypothetical protein
MEDLTTRFFEAFKSQSGVMKGYSLKFVEKSLSAPGEGEPNEFMDLDYAIQDSKIRLQFSLSLSDGTFLNVHIINENGSSISLDDYLTRHKMTEEKRKLFDISDDLQESLRLIFELFNNELNDIILGKRWEDIPFDWTSY